MIENDEIRTQVAATVGRHAVRRTSTSRRRSPSDCLPHSRGWRRFSPGSRARAPTGQPRPRSSGRACRRVWVEMTTGTQRQLVRLLDDDTDLHPDRGRRGRPRPASARDRARRPGGGDRTASPRGCPSPRGRSRSSRRASSRRRRRSPRSCARSPTGCGSSHSWSPRSRSGSRAGRRRLELRAIAIGLVRRRAPACWPYAASPATTWSTSSRRTTPSSPRRHDAWSILTQTLADRAWVWIILGVVTLLGVWFVGREPPRRSSASRRSADPREPADDVRDRRRSRCSCSRSSLRPSRAAG